MNELLQIYDEQGLPAEGTGATRDEIGRGLLHAAAHVWIWRVEDGTLEVLLQKRAPAVRTWAGCYDISTAGHIDVGEQPLEGALREAKEEIGLTITKSDLKLFSVFRAYLTVGNDIIENEFQWLYSLKCPDTTDFSLQASEVSSLSWVPMSQFRAACMNDQYVPHGKVYYDTVIAAIESEYERNRS